MPAENTQYSCHRTDLKSLNSRKKKAFQKRGSSTSQKLFRLNNLRVKKDLELWLKTPNAKVSALENRQPSFSLRKRQSMVLEMGLRFRPPLRHPPAAQFNIQIRDSRIQMLTRLNSFPSITSLGRRFCQQIGCKSRHSHLHDELYNSWVIFRDWYVCRDSRIKRQR